LNIFFNIVFVFHLGRDINLDVLRVQGYRRFCNKIWNAIRFAMAQNLDINGSNCFQPPAEFKVIDQYLKFEIKFSYFSLPVRKNHVIYG
jgi:valyl-tRNA synthetase